MSPGIASEAFNLTVGKQKPKFGWEWALSSRLIPTFERECADQSIPPRLCLRGRDDGKVDKWSYYAGVFSNDTVGDGDDTTEFGDFDGGWSGIASVGYDLSESFGLKKAQWRLDYIHSEHDENDDILTAFENGVSTSLELKDGSWGLLTEVLFGDGVATNWGLVLIPTYDITRKLQVVGRYQLGLSDEDTGLSAQRRYEREVGGAGGDMYNALYVGLKYFLFDGKDVEKKPEQKHRAQTDGRRRIREHGRAQGVRRLDRPGRRARFLVRSQTRCSSHRPNASRSGSAPDVVRHDDEPMVAVEGADGAGGVGAEVGGGPDLVDAEDRPVVAEGVAPAECRPRRRRREIAAAASGRCGRRRVS